MEEKEGVGEKKKEEEEEGGVGKEDGGVFGILLCLPDTKTFSSLFHSHTNTLTL